RTPVTRTPAKPAAAILIIAFGAAIFLSAVRLFSVQPLVGKLLLPLLGGAPSVWNTVMVFFQAMLLAGYAYAHFSVQTLGRSQPLVHIALLVIAAIFLPFTISANQSDQLQNSSPALWVLFVLAKNIGLPIFVLASTAPLLQKWFANTGHAAAKDPYFLYAASNLGSFGALFAYPLLVEPYSRLATQVRSWSFGFWILAAAIAICALLSRSRNNSLTSKSQISESPAAPLTKATIWKWIGLSFVPSSLMLGVTNYITTDVASVPLLWILPLALYLFTFVIAFSKHSKKAEVTSSRAVPILAIAVVFAILVQATEPVVVLVLMHLLFFLFAALQCHLKLANSRPPAAQLTQFYLCMSIGGVLGGIFNALLAPFLFSSIIEYPLMIVIATIIGFPERTTHKPKSSLPPIYGGAIVILSFAVAAALIVIASRRNIGAGNILAGLTLLGCYLLVRRPIRYAMALGTLLLCVTMFRQAQTPVLERDRNFFGVLRVADDSSTPLRRLYHGTTIHGIQFTQPTRKCEPSSYYHREGPVSEITALFQQSNLPPRVGLVGLGAGAMLTYSRPAETWTIYEIDPAVIRVAQDPRFFTYLSDCTPGQYRLEVGDARLRLQSAPDAHYGLIYIDAFSSDTIPMHLLSLEAVQLYRQKLVPEGILAFHLSSRNFDLEPLVANLGKKLGLHCFTSTRGELSPQALSEGGFESTWTILVPDTLQNRVVTSGNWFRVIPTSGAPLWTDDFSSLLGILRF
ncbi:MAG: spermidine synthase, partial [Limisphaerales bacterium]